jgi:PAS domain S-box-containing protein
MGGGNPMHDEFEINQLLIKEVDSLRQRIYELEEELRESEEKYRHIIENIEDCYFEVDLAGDFTFFNPSLCRILGYTKEEMSGMNYRVLMDAENANKVLRVFNEVYMTGIHKKSFELEVIRKDDTRMYIEVLISLIIRPGEKPTRFRGIARDITERKQMKKTLADV